MGQGAFRSARFPPRFPVGVMTAPMIPGLNDHELEAILDAAKAAPVAKYWHKSPQNDFYTSTYHTVQNS
jgi:hypothetical protein